MSTSSEAFALQVFYDTTLVFGIALMTVISIALPKKIKYQANGEMVIPSFMSIATVISLGVTSVFVFMNVLMFLSVVFGLQGEKGSAREYVPFKPHWVGEFVILLGLCCYVFIQTHVIYSALRTRNTILYIVRNYNGLPVEVLHEFCLKFRLSCFPVVYFENQMRLKGWANDTVGLLRKMSSDLTKYSILKIMFNEMTNTEANEKACQKL